MNPIGGKNSTLKVKLYKIDFLIAIIYNNENELTRHNYS
jgi:hypothetical protein